ncbi:MAG TPA: OmpA family protein [Gemmatimonadaceae bacterium]|nr:OmpA family protein [Gemmatimonadaceae bacterium]
MHPPVSRPSVRLAPLALGLALLPACASLSNKEKGAIIGATTGAAVGGAIGNNNGSTAKGAIIGAVVGGAAGAIIGHQMDQQAKELDQNIAGAKVERVGEGIQVTFESGLLFDFNSDAVSGNARTNLGELARSLDKYPNTNLLIVGHTDSVGSDDYNRRLSERRAAAAAEFLAAQGVARTRLQTRGLGESEPVASNATDSGRGQNRRVEVAIYASETARQNALRQAGSP